MANTFLILRPYGSGYSVVPTERDDAVMFHQRFMTPGAPPVFAFDTGVAHADYCACVCGWNFDAAEVAFALYLEKNMTSGFWDITWTLSGPMGAMAFIDVTFTAHGLCQVD